MQGEEINSDFIFKPKLFWWYVSWIFYLLFLTFGCTLFFGTILGLVISGNGNNSPSWIGYFSIIVLGVASIIMWLFISLKNRNQFKLNKNGVEIKYNNKQVSISLKDIKSICLNLDNYGKYNSRIGTEMNFVQQFQTIEVFGILKINKYNLIPRKILNFWTKVDFYYQLKEFISCNKIPITINTRYEYTTGYIKFYNIQRFLLKCIFLLILLLLAWFLGKYFLKIPFQCHSDIGTSNIFGTYSYNYCI